MSRLEKIRNNVFSKGNSYGADVEIVDDGECHEVVLHRGCTSRFRENELIDSVSSCLEKLGVDFSVLSDETCCGLMLNACIRAGWDIYPSTRRGSFFSFCHTLLYFFMFLLGPGCILLSSPFPLCF